jgi:hypothetical protein
VLLPLSCSSACTTLQPENIPLDGAVWTVSTMMFVQQWPPVGPVMQSIAVLAAMISKYFIRFRAIVLMIMPVGFNCGFEFEKGRQLLIRMHNKASRVLRLG